MIDYHSQLVSALKTIGIDVHYEMVLHSSLETPCISYMELYNAAEQEGDTLGYSRIQYQISIWANEISTIQFYVQKVDETLRPLGFKRIGSAELYDPNSTMIHKALTYECLALEQFT